MTLGDYVKQYRTGHGMNMRDFAAQCGVSAGYISMLENNRNPKTGEPITPTIENYAKLAAGMGMTAGELMAAVEDTIALPARQELPRGAIPFECNYMAPVLGRIPAGYPALAQDEIIGYHPVNVPNPEECFWLVVHGDSMIDAGIQQGDQVLIRKQPAADNGQIVACRMNGDDATLKRFHQQGDAVILYPANSKYQPIIVPKGDFENGYASIIGVVIEMRRGF